MTAERRETLAYWQAVDTVARGVLDDLVHTYQPDWGGYPEIGEHDWADVVDRIAAITGDFNREEQARAYALLAERAEKP